MSSLLETLLLQTSDTRGGVHLWGGFNAVNSLQSFSKLFHLTLEAYTNTWIMGLVIWYALIVFTGLFLVKFFCLFHVVD